ncbi:tyrosine-type recombinase/integrase [Blastococcus mobilis]|uniref:Site-specific recombinase XerD n=1 Tax=Blastococcus mobilis TaxID=1938746 RepID=A0A238VEU5_9ACTN|nr:site-specific integrase [Blastococcus mobilis]SNR32688.1 Site-specific recombinase XerD [Blastococcus mobilis]
MAYIRRLPSGKYQATVRHPAGHKVTRTDLLKRVVKAWADDLEAQFRRGVTETETGRKTTVGEWEARWTEARNVEANTAAKNASHMRTHVLPRWKTWPLASIGRLDVQTWVNDMTKAGAGADTVGGAYRLLSAMLHDAVLEGLLTASPCQEIDLPKVVKPEARWFTRDEYDRIQLALGGRTLRRGKTEVPDPLAHSWQAYVALGCFSGLRCPGELAGLDVRHLDFGRQQVHVRQVLTRHGMKRYPKTDSSNRWVPFPDEVGRLLWSLVADRPSGPVFLSPTGLRVNEANFRNRVWRPALELAGVDYEDPYTMRHTAASWWIQAGLPDYRVARLLGHSSTRMVSTYAHLDPNRDDDVRAVWAAGARVAHGENEESPRPAGRGL